MIVFRNKNGFTLIEVLLALAIIGLVLTPIFMGQTAIFRSANRAARSLSRIFTAKKLLVENEFALAPDTQEFAVEKKIDRPPTVFRYELKKIPENSTLKKFKNVLVQSVSWQDPTDKKKRSERLVTFVYKPEQE